MKERDMILARFEKNKDKAFTAGDLKKACQIDIPRVRSVLSRLIKEGRIVRIERGKYRYAVPIELQMDDKIKRYLATLEKTCAIAIHELMLTEPLVSKKEKSEIEHQIAYFARILVKSRWELEHGTMDTVDVDETIFRKAKKIHEWSKYVFEQSLASKIK